MIHSVDTEEEDGGRKKKKKKKSDGDREKGKREAMRGAAVGSFLFGSVNLHTPHTHIFIQLLSQKA